MNIGVDPTDKFIYSFEFQFSYEILNACRNIKLCVGANNFNFYKGKWRFNNLDIIDHIRTYYAHVNISEAVLRACEIHDLDKKKEYLVIKESENIKKKTDLSIIINGINGKLYPYQKLGVEFIINNNGKAILADEMGCGKSLQSIAYIAHKKFERSLVVCPASTKFSWECEIKKWTKLKPYIINSNNTDIMNIIKNYNIFIINYDILKKFYNELSLIKWDCIVGDEFQMIKSRNTQRTKFFKKLCLKINSVILLSGTPVLNRPIELFNALNIIDPHNWNDWFVYARKFCGGHQTRWGFDADGATNMQELQSRISRYFLRRTKKDVLSELPSKIYTYIPVELNDEYRKAYNLAMESFTEYLKKIKYKTDDEIKRSLSAESLVRLGELRNITSMGKIDSAKEVIDSVIDNGGKILVFSVYNKPLEILKEMYKDTSVILTGKTKDIERADIVNKFQNDNKIKIFLGGIKSAGVGITLTAASYVLFCDFSWVPADHLQASDRVHRIGQKADSVNVYTLYSRDTIDQYMKELLEQKKEIFDVLVDGMESRKGKQRDVNIVDNLLTKIKTEQHIIS